MAARLTAFGKAVRKHRIDADPTMKEMADEFGLSSAYLSAIETGDKPLPDAVVAKSIAFFDARGHDASDLLKMADRTRRAVNVEGLSENEREVVAEFARRLPGIPRARYARLLEEILARAALKRSSSLARKPPSAGGSRPRAGRGGK